MTNLLFGFQGRTNRAKFWLVALAIFVVEAILFAVLGSNVAMSDDPQEALARMGPVTSIVLLLFGILVTWISIAVGIKRFHDRKQDRRVDPHYLRAADRRPVVPDRVRLPQRHDGSQQLRSRSAGGHLTARAHPLRGAFLLNWGIVTVA